MGACICEVSPTLHPFVPGLLQELGDPSLTLSKWVHVAPQGRDHYVRAAPQHRLNLGLLAATLRSLLEALAGGGSDEVAVLVREGSIVVQTALSAVGFRPSATVAVTDFAQYVAHCASPRELLERLGIMDTRQDDLLALHVEASIIREVATFLLTLEAAARPYFTGRPEWAEILPGLAGWGHYQIDGGMNTPSPDPKIDIEIVINPGPSQ